MWGNFFIKKIYNLEKKNLDPKKKILDQRKKKIGPKKK